MTHKKRPFFCSIGEGRELRVEPKSQYVFFLAFSIAIGVVAGLGAFAFRGLIEFFQLLFWGGGDFLQKVHNAPWWLVVGLPTAAGLVVGPFITYVVPEARGPGVPEVIRVLADRSCRIRHVVSVYKALITSLLISAGASVGREGPIVQIGASVGSSFAQFFKLNPNLRPVCLAAGAAAGIAATFNAPLTGAVFAMEIILINTEIAYITHIILASVVASLLSRFFWGDFPTFSFGHFSLDYATDLPVYLLLGVASGLAGIVFIKSIDYVEMLFKKSPVPSWGIPGLGGFLLGCLGLYVPQALGVGYDTVNACMSSSLLLGAAVFFLLAKMLATALCIGSGMSGGILAPSMFLGATLGVVVSTGANYLAPDLGLLPGNFALVGMGALVAGTTLAPITAVLTIFELTYSTDVILPMMLASITSSMVVRLLYGYSAYERKLIKEGVKIVRGHYDNPLDSLHASDIMCVTISTLRESDSFVEILNKVADTDYPHFVVLDQQDALVGVLSMRDLKPYIRYFGKMEKELFARDIMTTNVVTIGAQGSVNEGLKEMEQKRVSCLPVMDLENTGKVIGVLKKDDVLRTYEEKIWRNTTLSSW